MSGLKNPMRFSVRPKTVDIKKYLGEDKRVTKMEMEPGQLYVYWEEMDD